MSASSRRVVFARPSKASSRSTDWICASRREASSASSAATAPARRRRLLFGSPLGQSGPDVAARQRIGFVTEDKELYPYMTVAQVIQFARPFFPGWRRDLEKRYLDLFQLPLNRKIPQLSKGMRSKLMLLLAMSHGAELLVLDEPMDGLDPAAAEELLRELTLLAASEGTTIFFSSHQIADVEQIADYVCIIDKGRTVIAGALDDLKGQCQRLHVVLDQDAPEPMRWVEGVTSVRRNGRMLSILASGNIEAVLDQARSLPGATVERFPVSLKEIFDRVAGIGFLLSTSAA